MLPGGGAGGGDPGNEPVHHRSVTGGAIGAGSDEPDIRHRIETQIRARIVLLAAAGIENREIGRRLELPVQIATKWRKRFVEEWLAGLAERLRCDSAAAEFPPRAGRLPSRRSHVSCRPSSGADGHMFVPDIRSEVLRRELGASISDAAIWRWLAEDAVKPWTHRSWVFPRDPAFELKAGRVLDLHAGAWAGGHSRTTSSCCRPMRRRASRPRIRRHPTLPSGPGRATPVEFEYECGARARSVGVRAAPGRGRPAAERALD